MKSSVSALVLAAGKGVRMKSRLAKVLHPIQGRPMIERVLTTLDSLSLSSLALIVGHQGKDVLAHLSSRKIKFPYFTQKKLNGSGGAVQTATSWLRRQRGTVLVTCGDTPLYRQETLRDFIRAHQRSGNAATVLTAWVPQPKGYGRILKSRSGLVLKIVEELDATPFEREIREINTGTYCFSAASLLKALPRLRPNNKKKEIYLTDVIGLLNSFGDSVGAHLCEDFRESIGINTRIELSQADETLFDWKRKDLALAGVTLIDPQNIYVEEGVKVGEDTILWPQTFLRGATKIGKNCEVGPWAHITDSTLHNHVNFKASFADGVVVEDGARVGPYSRLRPKTHVGKNAHIGNFSELKNAQLAPGVKVNHLSYVGDAKIGKNVNIGAGSITCNYDGLKKSPTFIEENAFIGSNVNLIAPVRVGANAVIGAGSSISENVPAWSLAVERSRTVVKKNWAKKKFKRKNK